MAQQWISYFNSAVFYFVLLHGWSQTYNLSFVVIELKFIHIHWVLYIWCALLKFWHSFCYIWNKCYAELLINLGIICIEMHINLIWLSDVMNRTCVDSELNGFKNWSLQNLKRKKNRIRCLVLQMNRLLPVFKVVFNHCSAAPEISSLLHNRSIRICGL